MSDELLPITEADVVPGAEFVGDNCAHRVVAVADGHVFTMSTTRSDGHGFAEGEAWRMATALKYWRKRAPKPPRYVVELRPPKQGEEWLADTGAVVVAHHDYGYGCPVIVEKLS